MTDYVSFWAFLICVMMWLNKALIAWFDLSLFLLYFSANYFIFEIILADSWKWLNHNAIIAWCE